MLVSSDAGCAGAAAGALRRRPRGAALRVLRFAVRFALRLADRLAVFFFDIFFFEALRDVAAFFAAFLRFLAMRAPPVEMGARILSDKLIARVSILRFVCSFLAAAAIVPPAFADQSGAPGPPAESPIPFERGTIEISVLGGGTLPVTTFHAKRNYQLAMASFAVGRVMAAGPGGNFELLVDVTPFVRIRQPNPVRGWSVAPLFLRWNFPAIGTAFVFSEGSGSLLFTNDPVRTTSFNFMEQVGFGVRFEESRRRAWLVGYRFQHISNGGRIQPNPGANFNLLYLGLSFIR
jgi:Lipid A 3-O-deacylase (PagL)